jgi:hypothetical protein
MFVSVTGTAVRIRRGYFRNTSLERQRCTVLLGSGATERQIADCGNGPYVTDCN